jgi:4-amino-4-deoxy-L-arabinose transferase-like glycosyltransferase
MWDESMFAVNTYEMIKNGSYFCPFFDGVPDNFNTKPVFSLWIQCGFVKLLGYNELAVRLPSAIATLIIVVLVFCFLYRYNVIWAWSASLVLLTSYGFIHFHTGRTAEADSLLTLFTFVANIYFIWFVLRGAKKDILYFFLFLSLAFASKMFASLLFVPAYFIILVSSKKFKDFVANRYFFWGLVSFLIISVAPIFLRELDCPGYLNEIVYKDAGRLFKVIESHKEDLQFYLRNLALVRFSTWFILFLFGVTLALLVNHEFKKLLMCLFLLTTSYFCVITISTTKLEWYDMPIYPYLACLAGYSIYFIISNLKLNSKYQIILVISLIFTYPYFAMCDKAQANTIPTGEKKLEANEIYLYKSIKENKNLDGVKVYFTGYNGSLLFYKYKLESKNQHITLTNKPEFNINDRVLVSNDSLRIILNRKYITEIDDVFDYSQLVKIVNIQ